MPLRRRTAILLSDLEESMPVIIWLSLFIVAGVFVGLIAGMMTDQLIELKSNPVPAA
jgi:hypothetical protein